MLHYPPDDHKSLELLFLHGSFRDWAATDIYRGHYEGKLKTGEWVDFLFFPFLPSQLYSGFLPYYLKL